MWINKIKNKENKTQTSTEQQNIRREGSAARRNNILLTALMRARVRVRECACVVQCSVVFWLTCRVWMCLSLVKSHFFCFFFFFFECQCNCYDTPPQPHHPLHAGAHTRAQRCCRRTLSIHINALEERFKENWQWTANPSPLLPRLFFFLLFQADE